MKGSIIATSPFLSPGRRTALPESMIPPRGVGSPLPLGISPPPPLVPIVPLPPPAHPISPGGRRLGGEELLLSKTREIERLRERVIELERNNAALLRDRDLDRRQGRHIDPERVDAVLRDAAAERDDLRNRLVELDAVAARALAERETMSSELRQTYAQLEEVRNRITDTQRVYAANFEDYKNQLGSNLVSEVERVRREMAVAFESEQKIMETEISKLRLMIKDLELKLASVAEERGRAMMALEEKVREGEEMKFRLAHLDEANALLANQNSEMLRAIDEWRIRFNELLHENGELRAHAASGFRAKDIAGQLGNENFVLRRSLDEAQVRYLTKPPTPVPVAVPTPVPTPIPTPVATPVPTPVPAPVPVHHTTVIEGPVIFDNKGERRPFSQQIPRPTALPAQIYPPNYIPPQMATPAPKPGQNPQFGSPVYIYQGPYPPQQPYSQPRYSHPPSQSYLP
eukprot:TRINITY_DN1202_c0_g2_i1.p1 TRINITY_DN1202_c0_g2~~TRINITY_DN1202_c0_g2_i1.p1  ORF type:complete len:458 (+),score=89.20 TRINITY_DN1202_c0_g2_i1:158-1531(+)